MAEDGEKKRPGGFRKRLWKILKSVFLTLAILYLLFLFLTSSFLICHGWMPLLSACSGMQFSAQEFRISPFRKGRNILVNELKIQAGSHASFTVLRMSANLDFRRFLTGKGLSLDRILLEDSEFLFTKIPGNRPARLLPDFLTRDLRIGSLNIDGLTLRYSPERSAQCWGVYLRHLNAESIRPGCWNKIFFHSLLSMRLPHAGTFSCPLSGNLRYKAGKNYLPDALTGTFETGAPAGKLHPRELVEIRLSGDFSLAMPEETPDTICLEHFKLTPALAGKKICLLECSGEYRLKTSSGTLSAALSAGWKNPIPGLLFLQGENAPENWMASARAELRKTGPEIAANVNLNASAERLICPDRTAISAPALSAGAAGSFRLDTGAWCLEKLSLEMEENSRQVFSLRNRGSFLLVRNPDQSWKTSATNAALQIQFDRFPLGIVHGLLPACWNSGRLSAEYFLRADSGSQSLTGKFSGEIKNAAVRGGGKSLIREHDIAFQMDFHSRGLDHVSGFDIPDFRVRQISNGKTIAEYRLQGRWSLPRKRIELSGSLRAKPLFLIRLLDAGELRTWFEKWEKIPGKERREMLVSVQMTVDGSKQEASFSANTALNTLAVLDPAHPERKIQLAAQGRVLFRNAQRKILLEHFSAAVPDLFLLSAKAESLFPEGIHSAELKLETLTPSFLRSAALLFRPENPDDREILERLDFDGISGHAKIRWSDPGKTLEITSAAFSCRQKPGEVLRAALLSPLKGNPAAGHFQDARAELIFENFPLSSINAFIPARTHFSFPGSPMNGRTEITMKDALREVAFKTDFMIESCEFQKRSVPFRYGDCRIRGQGVFQNYFETMSYQNATAEAFSRGEKNLSVQSRGTLLLRPPYTEDFKLLYTDIKPGHVAALLPGFAQVAKIRDFQGKASLDILCRDHFNDITFLFDLAFEKAAFQALQDPGSSFKPEFLHGKAHLNAQFLDKSRQLKIHPSELTISNASGNSVLQVTAAGSWLQEQKDHRSVCKISSSAADWRLIRKLLVNTGSTAARAGRKGPETAEEKEPQNPGKKSSCRWPFTGKEPGKFDLADYSAALDLSLQNWKYGNDITFGLNGTFLAEKNTFRAKSIRGSFNGAALTLDAFADLNRDNGWLLEGKLTVDNLDIAPFIRTFGPASLKRKNISGTVRRLTARGKTTGITLRNLDRNFSFAADASLRNFSFPMTDPDSFGPLRMLVLPLEFIPRLIDHIPGKTVGSFLRKGMGDQLDILSGHKNIELCEGEIRLRSAETGRKTDIRVEECELRGPYLKLRINSANFNPFHNELSADTVTHFCGMDYPLFFSGTLDSPEVDYARSIPDFFKYNSKNLAKNLLSGLSLGLYPLEEEKEKPEAKPDPSVRRTSNP